MDIFTGNFICGKLYVISGKQKIMSSKYFFLELTRRQTCLLKILMIYSTFRYRVNHTYFQVNKFFLIYTKTDSFTSNLDDLLDT